MNTMPITMLNGLACPGCGGKCGQPVRMLGAVSRDEVVKFFVGNKKWTKNTKPTNVYLTPGESAVRVIKPNDSFKIVGINEKANWGKLSTGEWVVLADSMYTVYLDTEPPKSITDAVTREAERAYDALPLLPSFKTTVIIAAIGVGVILLIQANNASQAIKKLKTTT